MFYVYALSLIKENLGEILSIGYMTTEQAILAKEQLYLLYKKVWIYSNSIFVQLCFRCHIVAFNV